MFGKQDSRSAGQFPANIAILDYAGVIMSVNESWRSFGRQNGLEHNDACVGVDYMKICRASGAPPALIDELDALLAGRLQTIAQWYSCHQPFPEIKRWFLLLGARNERLQSVTLAHIDVTTTIDQKMKEKLDAEHLKISS
jgi:hypothetical protein